MSVQAIRLSSPGEIAALVPHFVGFMPQESLVAISLRGARRRIGLIARVDLAHGAEAMGQIVSALRKDHAVACALVVHSEGPTRHAHPGAELVAAIEADLGRSGIDVLEAVLVRQERWWSYRCERECCPVAGTPIDRGAASVQRVAAEHAYQGRAVLASREELASSIGPVLPLGAAIVGRLQEQAYEDLIERLAQQPLLVAQSELRRWQDHLGRWEAAGEVPAPADAAALVMGLHVVEVRDEVAALGADSSVGLFGLVMALARCSTAPYDAPVCTLLGWLAYAQGDGALTRMALERALTSDPNLRLAALLMTALDNVVPPGQVRQILRPPEGPGDRRRGRRRNQSAHRAG